MEVEQNKVVCQIASRLCAVIVVAFGRTARRRRRSPHFLSIYGPFHHQSSAFVWLIAMPCRVLSGSHKKHSQCFVRRITMKAIIRHSPGYSKRRGIASGLSLTVSGFSFNRGCAATATATADYLTDWRSLLIIYWLVGLLIAGAVAWHA